VSRFLSERTFYKREEEQAEFGTDEPASRAKKALFHTPLVYPPLRMTGANS